MLNLKEQEETLKSLRQNLKIYMESIREVSEEILNGKVSKYPVFVAYREEVNIGKQIIDKEELALEWSINASTLEEFLRREIIMQDKLDVFKKSWKDPVTHLCLFTVLEKGAGFIYIPYNADE